MDTVQAAEGLIATIKSLLHERLGEDAEVTLETLEPDHRVAGAVVWDGFRGQDQVDRQNTIWEQLRTLPREQQLGIVAIMTFTHPEMAAMEEQVV